MGRAYSFGKSCVVAHFELNGNGKGFFAASVLNETARLIKDKLYSWLTRKTEENPSIYIMSTTPQVSLVIAMR